LARLGAVALFVERVQAIDASFALTVDNAGAIARICACLDGLPLAIELAAARTRVLTPNAIATRLVDAGGSGRLNLLRGEARDLPPRLRTLRNAVAWSHDLLDARSQALFRRLGVFAGGCTLEAIEAVCNADGALGDTLDVVAVLVDHSLLRREPAAFTATTDDEPRYGILETIREFARERLAASGEADALSERHAAFFTAMAEAAEPAYGTAAESAWLRRFAAEQPNLRVALEWAAEQNAVDVILRMTVALWWSWWVSSSVTDDYAWLERAVAATTDPPPALRGLRARLLAATGRTANMLGDQARAATLCEEGLAAGHESADAKAVALAVLGLGHLAIALGDVDRAEAFGEEALARWRDLAEPGWIQESLTFLGYVASVRGEHERAAAWFGESLDHARANGAVLAESLALEALGTCARESGEPRRAAALFAESLNLARGGHDPMMTALCLKSLGAVAAVVGPAEQAARLFGAAEALRERLGVVLEPIERPRLERAVEPARERLPEAAFAAAWAAGRSLPLDQAVAEALAVAEAVAGESEARSALPELSPREHQVLRLLADGLTDQQIADALFIGRRTVNTHVANILAKLGVGSRREAAALATERRLV
jgi:non-specific serine/threonine protein kinase